MSQILLHICNHNESSKRASQGFCMESEEAVRREEQDLVFLKHSAPHLFMFKLSPTLCEVPHGQVDTKL